MIVSVDKFQSKSAQAENIPVDFEAVFQENWGRVYAVLYRIVGDPAEAEDLALECFLRLYRQPPRAGMNLAGWLYRVAANLGFNALRARKRREQYELEAGKILLTAASPKNPDAVFEQGERRKRVRTVLARMRPQSAKILVLRHSGLSYAEVAAALRVSPYSVGTLLARAEQDFERRYRALEGS